MHLGPDLRPEIEKYKLGPLAKHRPRACSTASTTGRARGQVELQHPLRDRAAQGAQALRLANEPIKRIESQAVIPTETSEDESARDASRCQSTVGSPSTNCSSRASETRTTAGYAERHQPLVVAAKPSPRAPVPGASVNYYGTSLKWAKEKFRKDHTSSPQATLELSAGTPRDRVCWAPIGGDAPVCESRASEASAAASGQGTLVLRLP